MMISFTPQIAQALSYNHSTTVSAPIGISVDTSGPDLAPPPESQFFGFILSAVGGVTAAIVRAATPIILGITSALFCDNFIKGPQKR